MRITIKNTGNTSFHLYFSITSYKICIEMREVMNISVFLFIVIVVLVLLVGAVIGFFLARAWFKRYLEKNPPVNENMIKEMMRQMGRTPSQKQVNQILNSMNQYK
jgi:uncharacterized protein